MSEKRLQEIKDSVEFQYTLAKAKGYDNALLFTNEEEELIEEIERLHSIIKEVREYIAHYIDNEYRNGRDDELYLELNEKELKELLEILDKEVD